MNMNEAIAIMLQEHSKIEPLKCEIEDAQRLTDKINAIKKEYSNVIMWERKEKEYL